MEHDRLSGQERGRLWIRLSIRMVLIIAVILLILYVGLPLLSLLLPFVLALIVAWILNPLVRWFQRKLSISRKIISMVLVILLFCVIGGILCGLVWAAVAQIRSLLLNWESVTDTFLSTVHNVTVWLNQFDRYLPQGILSAGNNLTDYLVNWLRGLDFSRSIAWATTHASDLVSGLSGFAVAAVVFITASYFITSDYPRLRFLLTDRVSADTRTFWGSVRTIFMNAFGGYLKSQLILSLGVFVILAVGFTLIHQPYGLVMAGCLAILDFIPIIGAGTVMVPWMVADLISQNWYHAIGFAVIWGLIVLFRRIAEPKILGDQTGLSPILSLVGIYVGMRLSGVLGMIIGPLLILVCINLAKMGVFRPVFDDLRTASHDIRAILRAGHHKSDS